MILNVSKQLVCFVCFIVVPFQNSKKKMSDKVVKDVLEEILDRCDVVDCIADKAKTQLAQTAAAGKVLEVAANRAAIISQPRPMMSNVMGAVYDGCHQVVETVVDECGYVIDGCHHVVETVVDECHHACQFVADECEILAES